MSQNQEKRRPARRKSNSMMPVIIFAVIIALIGVGYLQFQKGYVSSELQKVKALLAEAEELIDSAKVTNDPDTDFNTRTSLESMKTKLGDILPKFKVEYAQAKRLNSRADEIIRQIDTAASKRNEELLVKLEADKVKKKKEEAARVKAAHDKKMSEIAAASPKPEPAAAPAPASKPAAKPASSPSTRQKPSQAPPKTELGKWAFNPAKDNFQSDALVDLRSLNEKTAGERGFIKRSKDGNDFVYGDGKPMRIWSLNSGAFSSRKKPDLERHGRFLAKRGINMIRFHGHLPPAHSAGYVRYKSSGNTINDINLTARDNLWRTVAAMKKSGVYVTFSPYWANCLPQKREWGLLDGGKGKGHGLLFIDEKLKAAYKEWWKKVLTEKNPHTGISLAKDPALGILQIQNEDSLLFWTSQAIENSAAAELRKKYGTFLKKKYGSLEKAKAAWGGHGLKGDNFANGEAGLDIIWQLTQKSSNENHKKRMADQMEYITTLMYDFNKEIGDFLRNECGAKQVVNAGNWRTADNVKMLDAERYSYSANEVMAVNRYYTGIHKGKNQGWAIVPGDTFTDESVLLRPRHLPVNLKQVLGFPIMITESSWVPPLSYQSEGPFLVAAYSSLSGVDSYYWFATGEEDWRQPDSSNGFLRPSIGKWVCATPMLMGQWPAAALMFRKGYIKQAEPAVYEERSLEDLWYRKMPIIAEDAGYDPNRDKGDIPQESNVKDGAHPLSFLVGPVVVKYKGTAAKNKVVDLNRYIDDSNRTVTSMTGELSMDYGKGICTLNAPKAQGVTGFLGQVGSFKTNDLEITCENHYATLLAVSLDEKDLAKSGSILIQMGTTERPTGWRTTKTNVGGKSGERISATGNKPWQIEIGKATIKVSNAKLKTAVVCDVNFMPVREIKLEDGKFAFPEDALYVVLK